MFSFLWGGRKRSWKSQDHKSCDAMTIQSVVKLVVFRDLAWEGPQSLIVFQPLSGVWLFVTPWIAACQASLSFTISWNFLKLISIESVMPSDHLVLCHPLFSCPQSFPASGSFPKSQVFASGSQSIGASDSASVLPMNIQGWFPLGLTGLISLSSEGLLKAFSSTTVWKHQFFSTQPSLWFNSHLYAWLLKKL